MGASALPEKLIEELHTAPRRKRKKDKSNKEKSKGTTQLIISRLKTFQTRSERKRSATKKIRRKIKKSCPDGDSIIRPYSRVRYIVFCFRVDILPFCS